MAKKSCFIIMPFSKAIGPDGDLNQKTLNYIYEHIIYKAVSEYKIKNKKVFNDISRYNAKVGSIINGIIRNLNGSDLVIADLTGLNHNVMYELGVRHTLKRGTIIITQDLSTIPSDLRDYLCVDYKYTDSTIDQTNNYNHFQEILHQAITEILETEKFDSPVLNYLKGKELYWKEDEMKILKENLIIAKYIFEYFEAIHLMIEAIKKEDKQYSISLFNSLITCLSSAIKDLHLPLEDSKMYSVLQGASTLLEDVSKKTVIADYYNDVSSKMPDDASKNIFQTIINIHDKSFINYFALEKGNVEQISLADIFSKEHVFYKQFMAEIERILEEKAKELKLNKSEIKKMFKK